jgi:Matrixin
MRSAASLRGATVSRIAAALVLAAVLCGTAAANGFVGFRLLHLDGLLVRWNSADFGRPKVTYAFVREPMQFEGARNCEAMVPATELLARSQVARVIFEQEVEAAFAMWEQAANIKFERTEDMAHAGILIGAQRDAQGHAFADVKYRAGKGRDRDIERSLICLNPLKRWKVGFDGNLRVYDLRYTIAHEIGHAIGLDHPDAADELMSFRYTERFRTLQPGDIYGAVEIYGPRKSFLARTAQ